MTGSETSGRSAVLGALLGLVGPVVEPPATGYLVVRYGPAGGPRPTGGPPGETTGGPPGETTGRPPRRTDITFADPLLRHVALVDTPSVDRLGVAGIRILADAAGRAGAVVHTVRCGDPLGEAEVSVLTALVHAGVAVFLVLTPDEAGRWRGPAGRGSRIDASDTDDSAAAAIQSYRRAVGALVPALSDVEWHTVDPAAADATQLRRALTTWAAQESVRRAGDGLPSGGATIALPPGADTAPWQQRLDRVHRGSRFLVRHRLAIELAGLQQRCARHFQLHRDPIGLLRVLDDELHALSLYADAITAHALAQSLTVVLDALFAGVVPRSAQGGLAAALRDRVAADELDRVLWITPAGGVVARSGRGLAKALRAYPTQLDVQVVPHSGVALTGEWWDLSHVRRADEILDYLDRMVTELESALADEVDRRFRVVREALGRVVGDAVHIGILAW